MSVRHQRVLNEDRPDERRSRRALRSVRRSAARGRPAGRRDTRPSLGRASAVLARLTRASAASLGCDPADSAGKRRPVPLGPLEGGQTASRESVVAAAWPALASAPRCLKSSLGLEPVQGWIERPFTGGQRLSAPLADPASDVVAVELAAAKRREDEQGQGPLQELSSDLAVLEQAGYLAFQGT